MRSIVKNIAGSILFFVILIILLLLVSHIVEPKNNSQKNGIQDYAANGILSEPKDTIDALILGDSETYSSFIPLKIWQDYGITSYVCGTSKQKLCYTEEFLHKTFRNQSPKIVVLETNAIFRKFSYSDVIGNKLKNTFSVFRYHNRWKSLQPEDWSFSVNYTYVEINKGYRYNEDVKSASTKKYMKPSDGEQPIPSKNISYVQSIKEFCDQNGAEMIMLTTPSTKNWNFKKHNSMVELANKLGVEYIDLNLLKKKVPINWKTDTRDKGDHLNHAGALKVSNYLGEYLAEKNLFKDKRENSEYSAWNKALNSFNKATSNSLVDDDFLSVSLEEKQWQNK